MIRGVSQHSLRPGWRSRARLAAIGAAMAAAGLAGLALAQTAAPPGTEDLELRPSTDAPLPVLPAEAHQQPDTPPDALSEQREALSAIEASITLSRERADALRKEIADMQGDRTQQNAALIAAAQRVKLAEADIARLEDRLGELIVQELEVRGRLDGADANISTVLAALERISRTPPPAMMVDPSDALGSARSAMLISAILPELRSRAEAVMADLKRLDAIKADALAEQDKLEVNLQILEEEQLRIGTLIAARKQTESQASDALAAEEAEAQALADKATSIKDLIDDLTKRAAAIATAADATARANAGNRAPLLDPATIKLALANTARTEPAVPFAQARGYLAMPSSGETVVQYGGSDGFGGISRGLSVVTRAEAQVVAPADGWVLYQGEYLNYGQIVILNAGQDYTILLAGLDRVDVDIDQFVMMGEPLGAMGSQTIGQTVATGAGVSRPTLYIEMRKNNEPVDPTGWWASTGSSTQSG